MSLAQWWKSHKVSRQTKRIERNKKRIKNCYGYGEDRQKAVAFFQSLGGQVGASGLLERFMVNVNPSIRDEEEKEEVFRVLVDLGVEIVPAIESYLNREDSALVPITWPLKVLTTLAPAEESVAVILRALQRLGTTYTREPDRKVLLVSTLGDLDHPDIVPALIPFLLDHRDEVQLEALAVLTRKADERARDAMLALLVEVDTPVRLRASIAEALAALTWDVKGFRKKVEEALPEGFHLDRSGRVKGRWVHAPEVTVHPTASA